MEKLDLKIWNPTTGEELDALVEIDDGDGCKIDIGVNGICRWQADEGNFSSALANVRSQMELLGLFPLCNGACRDVVLSRMGRQMSGGRKAYKISIGKQALRENLVDIFEPAPKGRVGTLEEQKEFYEKWIKSL